MLKKGGGQPSEWAATGWKEAEPAKIAVSGWGKQQTLSEPAKKAGSSLKGGCIWAEVS
ncbi:hypothetical protein HQN90_02935 [Paenibacillus alba]|uniref:hypothetical protein n=1 Tax=Paenibacillus alba TaxID=1197127 RepID=UPI0015667F87|nr:hypothetical protein [Paenibacillus alba]NQX65076.1 hypothetical protein [Paenibacillus alba]